MMMMMLCSLGIYNQVSSAYTESLLRGEGFEVSYTHMLQVKFHPGNIRKRSQESHIIDTIDKEERRIRRKGKTKNHSGLQC